MLTQPLKSLDSLMFPLLPIERPRGPDINPPDFAVPETLQDLGRKQRRSGHERRRSKYDPPKGAARARICRRRSTVARWLEKTAGGRLVGRACIQFAWNQIIGNTRSEAGPAGNLSCAVSRKFGAVLNSVFWLRGRSR